MTNRTNRTKGTNKKILVAALVFFLASFSVANAAGIVPCGDGSPCTLCHLIVGFHNLVSFLLKLVVTIALAGIFFAGVMYILSSGNEGMITSSKNFLRASVMGFAIVLGAWLIVNVTMWALSAKDSNGDGVPDFGIATTGKWNEFSCSTTNPSATSNGGGAAGYQSVNPNYSQQVQSAHTPSLQNQGGGGSTAGPGSEQGIKNMIQP